MKTLGNILAFLLALAALALVIWGGYIGVRFLVSQFELVSSREMPVLIIASVVFLAGAFIISSAIRSALHRHDKQLHPEKAELYYSLMAALHESRGNPEQLAGQFETYLPQVQLWAGDEVLKSYKRLRELAGQSEFSEEKISKEAGKLMLEIRKDIGHKNRGIHFSPFANR